MGSYHVMVMLGRCNADWLGVTGLETTTSEFDTRLPTVYNLHRLSMHCLLFKLEQ